MRGLLRSCLVLLSVAGLVLLTFSPALAQGPGGADHPVQSNSNMGFKLNYSSNGSHWTAVAIGDNAMMSATGNADKVTNLLLLVKQNHTTYRLHIVNGRLLQNDFGSGTPGPATQMLVALLSQVGQRDQQILKTVGLAILNTPGLSPDFWGPVLDKASPKLYLG